MEDSELDNKIRHLLRKHRVRCRLIRIEESQVILGIEASKSAHPTFIKDLRYLNLFPMNIVYGRWAFKRS